MSKARAGWLTAGAVVWAAVVAYCTLTSDPAAAYRIPETSWHCIVCGDGGITDTLLNLLLYAPFGVLARAAGWPLRRIAVLACCCSTAIELTQANFLVGRDGTLGDVLTNTLSAILGWLSLPTIIALARPTVQFARRSAAVVLILSTLIWIGTGFGLRPSLDGPAPWVGQRLHLWGGHDPFPGTLQQSTLDGVDVPNDPLATVPARQDTLDLVIEATRTTDRIPVRPVAILRVVDDRLHVQVGISQNGNSLTLEGRVRASDFLFRTPEWRFPDAMNVAVNQPQRFEWRWSSDKIQLITAPVAEPNRERITTLPLSAALGWIFIHPFLATFNGSAALWTALWLAWWFGALAWCAGGADDRAMVGFGVAGIVAFAAAAFATKMPLQQSDLAVATGSYVVVAAIARSLRRR